MANYTIYSFQTLNLPTVQVDTDFIIYKYATSTPGTTLTNLIYSGRIVAGYHLDHVDEILSQYVKADNLSFVGGDHLLQDEEQRWTFYIYTSTDDWETFTSDTITVIYDWSYDYEPTSIKPIKSSIPIKLMDYRQFAIQSMMSRDGSMEHSIVLLDNTTIDTIAFDGDATWTYFRWLNDGGIEWPDEFFVNTTSYVLDISGIKYTVANTCYNYCLYYVNQWGGYDYMLFGGRELQTDNLSRLSYKQQYRANSWQFGQVDYQTTIDRRWSLNTSWVTDIQASKLKHLFSSNKMWLQDLTDGSKTPTLVPVNITNTSYEHKNWKNQSRKLYTYTIELKASQSQYRI